MFFSFSQHHVQGLKWEPIRIKLCVCFFCSVFTLHCSSSFGVFSKIGEQVRSEEQKIFLKGTKGDFYSYSYVMSVNSPLKTLVSTSLTRKKKNFPTWERKREILFLASFYICPVQWADCNEDDSNFTQKSWKMCSQPSQPFIQKRKGKSVALQVYLQK